jgi:hypothetical protein
MRANPHERTPGTQQYAGLPGTTGGRCFIPVSDFISLAFHQRLAKRLQVGLRSQRTHLLGVVVVDECFDRLDRGVDRPGTQQGRQRTGEKTSEPPDRQQTAVVHSRQPGFNGLQVLLFSRQVMLGEGSQARVARNPQHPVVNAHRADFACMVCSEVSNHPSGQIIPGRSHCDLDTGS